MNKVYLSVVHIWEIVMKTKLTTTLLLLSLLLTACLAPSAPLPTQTLVPTSPGIPTSSPLPELSFLAQPSGTVRLMSFNVGWDSIFPDGDPLNDPFRAGDRSDAYARILAAVQPQVICFQEINPRREPQQVADILERVIPPGVGKKWQVHSAGDNVIAAVYNLELTGSAIVQGNPLTGRGHAMALVDLPDGTYTQDLYLVCSHFKSQGGTSNIKARQDHADAIIAWIRDMQTPGDEIDLPHGTPFSILGDLNVYDTDPAHHLVTLLQGDIVNEAKYGPDLAPDWDGTSLKDALPRHNGDGIETFTWFDETQEFNPGVLDHILYSDSVIRVENSFVLNTMTLSPEALAAAGLQAEDVMLEAAVGNYDHLPLVVDISFQPLPSNH